MQVVKMNCGRCNGSETTGFGPICLGSDPCGMREITKVMEYLKNKLAEKLL
jgi:hypothetical protein